jgi:hypothetical protein
MADVYDKFVGIRNAKKAEVGLKRMIYESICASPRIRIQRRSECEEGIMLHAISKHLALVGIIDRSGKRRKVGE